MDTKVQKKVFYNKFSPSSVSYSTYLLVMRIQPWDKPKFPVTQGRLDKLGNIPSEVPAAMWLRKTIRWSGVAVLQHPPYSPDLRCDIVLLKAKGRGSDLGPCCSVAEAAAVSVEWSGILQGQLPCRPLRSALRRGRGSLWQMETRRQETAYATLA
jgi:hypothetical protein